MGFHAGRPLDRPVGRVETVDLALCGQPVALVPPVWPALGVPQLMRPLPDPMLTILSHAASPCRRGGAPRRPPWRTSAAPRRDVTAGSSTISFGNRWRNALSDLSGAALRGGLAERQRGVAQCLASAVRIEPAGRGDSMGCCEPPCRRARRPSRHPRCAMRTLARLAVGTLLRLRASRHPVSSPNAPRSSPQRVPEIESRERLMEESARRFADAPAAGVPSGRRTVVERA